MLGRMVLIVRSSRRFSLPNDLIRPFPPTAGVEVEQTSLCSSHENLLGPVNAKIGLLVDEIRNINGSELTTYRQISTVHIQIHVSA